MSTTDDATPEGTPVHLLIPAHDTQRAVAFYRAVFPSWQITHNPIATSPPDDRADIVFPGPSGTHKAHGSILRMRWADPAKHLHGGVECGYATHYFYTYDLEAAMVAVEKAGGCVLMGRTGLGGGGRWVADFRDTEGNFFGLFTVKPAG